MKKLLKITLPFFVVLTICTSCSDDESVETTDSIIELPIGEPVSVANTSLALIYTKLKEDSRCPFDVACIWEGRAWAELHGANGPGIPAPFDLITENSMNQDSFVFATIPDYTIELIDIFPDPSIENSRTDSVVVVKVEMQ